MESTSYPLTDSQLIEGIEYCFDKVARLLDNVETLIDNQKNFWESSHALGLYTFAIEEFGKALLLKDHYKKGDQNIHVPTWIFSKGRFPREIKSHDEKIKRAFNDLPEPCKKIMMGITIDKPSPNTTTIRLRGGGAISASGMTSGLFMTDNGVDFEVRMKCFYLDWNKDEEKWDYELTTAKEYLKDAVSCFKKELAKAKSSMP